MTDGRATFRDVLAVPVFRVVFLTRALAIGADTLRTVALSVLVFASTGSALLGALTFGASFLPQAIGGLVIGALPDLVRPRPLIVAGYTIEAGGAALLALGDLPVAASLGLVAGIGCLAPVFNGTAGRLTATSLSGDAFVVGRGLFQIAASAAQLLGLACGGIAVGTMGPKAALLIAAGAHLVAAIAARVALPDLPAPARVGQQSLVRQSWRGNRKLLAEATVRRLLLAMWLPPAFVTGAESLLIPYAAQRHYPDSAAGLILACIPVGMLIGDLVVTRCLAPRTRERLVVALVVLLGAPLIAFAADLGVVLAGALMMVTGCGFAYGIGLQRKFKDAVRDDAMGQAFGLMSTGLMTLQGIGPALWGALTEWVPVSVAMTLGGVATVVTALWIGAGGALSEPKTPVPSHAEDR